MKEMKKEVIDQQYEEIRFQDKSQKRNYLVRAPINPSFTTGVYFEVTEEEETDTTIMLLSTDMEQVSMLFAALRSEDRQVIAAFDWIYLDRQNHGGAAYVLCYDFVSHCPVVQIVYKNWMKDNEI